MGFAGRRKGDPVGVSDRSRMARPRRSWGARLGFQQTRWRLPDVAAPRSSLALDVGHLLALGAVASLPAGQNTSQPGVSGHPRTAGLGLRVAAKPKSPYVQVAKKDDPEPADAPAGDEHPFPQHLKAPALDGGVEWINTAGPIDLQHLRGKFVLLDFWTYCCINCMHILPELKKLEQAYPNELVVIGVHSAKFATEQDSKNIREAIQRYEIEHPVINDAQSRDLGQFGVNSWPTLC